MEDFKNINAMKNRIITITQNGFPDGMPIGQARLIELSTSGPGYQVWLIEYVDLPKRLYEVFISI